MAGTFWKPGERGRAEVGRPRDLGGARPHDVKASLGRSNGEGVGRQLNPGSAPCSSMIQATSSGTALVVEDGADRTPSWRTSQCKGIALRMVQRRQPSKICEAANGRLPINSRLKRRGGGTPWNPLLEQGLLAK
jgi:hypothetical protein